MKNEIMEDWLPDPRPQGVSIDPITQCRLTRKVASQDPKPDHRKGQSATHA